MGTMARLQPRRNLNLKVSVMQGRFASPFSIRNQPEELLRSDAGFNLQSAPAISARSCTRPVPRGDFNLGPGSVFNADSAEKPTFRCFIPNPDSRIQRPDPERSAQFIRGLGIKPSSAGDHW